MKSRKVNVDLGKAVKKAQKKSAENQIMAQVNQVLAKMNAMLYFNLELEPINLDKVESFKLVPQDQWMIHPDIKTYAEEIYIVKSLNVIEGYLKLYNWGKKKAFKDICIKDMIAGKPNPMKCMDEVEFKIWELVHRKAFDLI